MVSGLVLAVILTAAPAPPLPASLELELGEERLFTVPGLMRLAVSGADVYDAKPMGRDRLLIIGATLGRSTILGWLSNGVRITVPIRVTPPKQKRQAEVPTTQSTQRIVRVEADGGITADQVQVIEIPEELTDLREVGSGDGGLVLEGTAADGTVRRITLTPKP